MRCVALAVILLSLFGAAGGCAAGKITVDPNATPKVTASAPAQWADERLGEKITYSSGEKRLHDVVDELTKLTGVEVRAGYNAKDWQVRDIPLVVAARGLPLGRLLKAIAESTHTLLACKTAGNGKPTYRLYRTGRMQQEINAYLRTQHETALADAGWAWDAMVGFSKSEAGRKHDGERDLMVAKLLATLGPDAKSRVLAGESVQVDASGPQGNLVRDIQMAHWRRSNLPDHPGKEPTQEQLDASALTVKLVDPGEGSHAEVYAVLSPNPQNIPCMVGLRLTSLVYRLDKLKELNLPPRPEITYVAGEIAPSPSADLEMMEPSKMSEFVPESKGKAWAGTELDVDVDLPVPEKRIPTFADKFTALADATGVSIVAEDFRSHQCDQSDNTKDKFGHNAKASDLLRDPQHTWFLSKESDLLVGWSLRGRLWHVSHAHLVPESLISGILNKLDTEVELDDVTPIAALTEGQRNDWFQSDPRMRWLLRAFSKDRAVWSFYDALAPDDKKLARSDAGLRLAKFDLASLEQFLKESQDAVSRADFPVANTGGEQRKSLRELLDPAVLPTLVMRVKSTPADLSAMTPNVDMEPHGKLIDRDGLMQMVSKLHTYHVEIDYSLNGAKKTARFEGPAIGFPVFSQKRFCEPAAQPQ